MGFTAEFLAQTQSISRAAQDDVCPGESRKGRRGDAVWRVRCRDCPGVGLDEAGDRTLVAVDQCIRPDASLAALAALKPAFMPGIGTVTAGNSSPLNDGAAALLMMSDHKARDLGLQPLVKVRATAVVGVDPAVMGTGPVPATRLALERAGLTLADIDLVELNEAFAAQALACQQLLGIDGERLNVRGGALAIGHPLGASGARIATTLIHALVDRDATLGLATMCIGFGQGIATVFERV